MNRLVVILSIILFGFRGQAQMTLAIQHNNILYVGIDNKLQFSVANIKMADVRLVASWGQLSRNGNEYSWKTCDTHRNLVTFFCYRKNKAIDSVTCRVKPVPEPMLMVATGRHQHRAGIIDSQAGVIALLPEADFDISFSIKQFTFRLIRNGTIVFEIRNDGARFESDLMSRLVNLEPGDQYQLINVVVSGPCNNADRRIRDSEIFTVK